MPASAPLPRGLQSESSLCLAQERVHLMPAPPSPCAVLILLMLADNYVHVKQSRRRVERERKGHARRWPFTHCDLPRCRQTHALPRLLSPGACGITKQDSVIADSFPVCQHTRAVIRSPPAVGCRCCCCCRCRCSRHLPGPAQGPRMTLWLSRAGRAAAAPGAAPTPSCISLHTWLQAGRQAGVVGG